MRMMVVFPAPFGPIMPNISPWAMLKEISLTMDWLLKDFDICETSTVLFMLSPPLS